MQLDEPPGEGKPETVTLQHLIEHSLVPSIAPVAGSTSSPRRTPRPRRALACLSTLGLGEPAAREK